jgi:uncharacterized protein (TIGR02453 family)
LIPFFVHYFSAEINFTMIKKETLKFLKELKQNNNKPWFEKNRQRFDDARTDFGNMIDYIIGQLGKSDPDIAGLQSKNCIFRQNRDIRFSKDKTPYKISMGAYMNKGGKKINTPGYYIHLEPGKSFVAGGLYQPEAGSLAKVRQEIDYNLKEWQSIITKPAFRKIFVSGLDQNDILTRPPKGYEADNPALEYLKLKGFTVSSAITDSELQDPNSKKQLLQACIQLQPLIKFLNRAIE